MKHHAYPGQELRNIVAQSRKSAALYLHTSSENDRSGKTLLRRRTNLSVKEEKSGRTKNVHAEAAGNSNNAAEARAFMTDKSTRQAGMIRACRVSLCNRVHGMRLLDLLLQCVKFRCGEKFAQRDLQPVADHFDRDQLGIPAFSIENIFDTGWGKGADRGRRLMLISRSPHSCKIRSLTAEMVLMYATSNSEFDNSINILLANIGYACNY